MPKLEILKSNQIDVDAALSLWGDIESYSDALKEFKESIPQKLENLKKMIQEENYSEYAILTHSMKSEAKYLGFMKHAETFYEHELKGKENNGFFIKENFKNLENVAKNILAILADYFEEKKNLLIADDSNIILNFLEKNIKDDFNVLKAQDGKTAVDHIKNNSIYAIFLDLNMPTYNGFEVLDYLKETELTNEIPVIIITGDDETKNIEKAFSYHVLNVLKKPFNDNNIKSSLEAIKNFYEKSNF